MLLCRNRAGMRKTAAQFIAGRGDTEAKVDCLIAYGTTGANDWRAEACTRRTAIRMTADRASTGNQGHYGECEKNCGFHIRASHDRDSMAVFIARAHFPCAATAR